MPKCDVQAVELTSVMGNRVPPCLSPVAVPPSIQKDLQAFELNAWVASGTSPTLEAE